MPTNWDPTKTQQLLTGRIAKYPKIDVIVSDFGPTLVSSLPLFTKSGRPIPALATSDGNSLSCFWQSQQARTRFKMITVATGNDNVRLAVRLRRRQGDRRQDPDRGPASRARCSRTRSAASRTRYLPIATCPATSTCPPRCPATEQAQLGK